MKRTATVVLLLASVLPGGVNADCIKNQYGNVVCGKGQCETDPHGKIFCAEAGGGAIQDEHADVLCGVGYCAKDQLAKVWCSKVQSGGAETDSAGHVKCLGGCEAGSPKRCHEAQ